MTAYQMVRALRNEDLVVEETRDWRDHNRHHKGSFSNVNGVMIHHTLTSGTKNTVKICHDGRSDLPGPLCHGVIGRHGVYMVGTAARTMPACATTMCFGPSSTRVRYLLTMSRAPTATRGSTACENLGNGTDPWPEMLEVIE
jgi:hypothetical protein